MAKRGVKKRDYERLDDLTVGRVVSLLGQETPITKKAACETLNISYNTKRLAAIIQEYEEKIAYSVKRKKQMKGQPFGDRELQDLVVSYLSGESVSSISQRLFRSIHIIRGEINKHNLPTRDKTTDYHHPKMMPEGMVSQEFDVGDYAWSARYNCVVEIMEGEWDLMKQEHIYSIYIFGKYMQFGYQPTHELGKLEILKQFTLRDDDFKTSQNFDMRIG